MKLIITLIVSAIMMRCTGDCEITCTCYSNGYAGTSTTTVPNISRRECSNEANLAANDCECDTEWTKE